MIEGIKGNNKEIRTGRKIWKRVKRFIFRIDDSCNTIHWKIVRTKIKI